MTASTSPETVATLRPRPATLPHPSSIWNALPAPILLLRPDGSVALANSAAEGFMNSSQSWLMERGWECLFAPDSPVRSLVQQARYGSGAIAAYDLIVEFVGGRKLRADVLVGTLADRHGWLTLSFQPRAVSSLVNRQMGQQGAARSAEGVAAMLAHEIKNPLSGIRGAAQLLETTADAQGKELTALIIAEVERVRALIDRMEDFTGTPRQLRPENIHSVLSHVRQLAQTGFGQAIRFREDYDPSLPDVLGDRDSLVQAFLNLVKNAVEASPPGGTVTIATAFRQGVRVRSPGSSARLSLPLEVRIIDEGEGPPAHIVDHLFEPFVSHRRGGSGLGLALVAKVVGDHNGIVEHERLGRRTVFRVLLQLAPGKKG